MLSLTPPLKTTLIGPAGEFIEQMRVVGVRHVISQSDTGRSYKGEPYTLMTLSSTDGSISAILWHRRFPDRVVDFSVGDIAEFEGIVRTNASNPLLEIREFQWIDPSNMAFEPLFPLEWAPAVSEEALNYVKEGWLNLSSDALRAFVNQTFLNTDLVQSFLNCPASVKYHHAFQGGLFAHVSEMVVCEPKARYSALDSDIEFVLSLVHDIGKTVTMSGGKISTRGRYQSHEVAALEILA